MRRRCPNPRCLESPSLVSEKSRSHPGFKSVIRRGTFYRKRDRRFITRYLCRNCGKCFSSSTHSPDYRQKKPELNDVIFKLCSSGVSQNRLAVLLDVNPKTIVRKFRLQAARSRIDHEEWKRNLPPHSIREIQFDDLETFEHTKCKPLSVTLAVNKETREIIDVRVSVMPAKGLLAKISRKKYGKRKDERPRALEGLISGLRSVIHPEGVIESDENPHYPKHVRRHLPETKHIRHPGARGAITGQGELKKIGFDPLFSLNHTCAMLRANMNRLFRRTWCTTKNVAGLIDHLSIYIRYHNTVLLDPGYPALQAQ